MYVLMNSIGIKGMRIYVSVREMGLLGKLDRGLRIATGGCHDGVNGDKLR